LIAILAEPFFNGRTCHWLRQSPSENMSTIPPSCNIWLHRSNAVSFNAKYSFPSLSGKWGWLLEL